MDGTDVQNMVKTPETTIPELMKAARHNWPNAVWMRHKQSGLWREYTWHESWDNIEGLTLGLIELGFGAGQAICITADTHPHWFWAEIAAQTAGGTVVPVSPDSSPEHLKGVLLHSGATIVVAQDQEQVDKVLEIKAGLPGLKRIIYWNAKGMRGYKDPLLATFQQVLEAGRRQNSQGFEKAVDDGKAHSPALVQYHGGQSQPRVLSHADLLAACDNFCLTDPIYFKDEWFCSTDPANPLEQAIGLVGSLTSGMTLNIPESPHTSQLDMREIGPTLVLCQPEYCSFLAATIEDRIEKGTFLKRKIGSLCLPIGKTAAELKMKKEPPVLKQRIFCGIAHTVLFRPLQARLGLARTRRVYSSGAIPNVDCWRLLLGVGLDLRHIELTEHKRIMQHVGNKTKTTVP